MSEYNFFLRNDFSKYSGQWIAILKNKVVAHGNNFKEVAETIDKKFTGTKPLLTRVPTKVRQLL